MTPYLGRVFMRGVVVVVLQLPVELPPGAYETNMAALMALPLSKYRNSGCLGPLLNR